MWRLTSVQINKEKHHHCPWIDHPYGRFWLKKIPARNKHPTYQPHTWRDQPLDPQTVAWGGIPTHAFLDSDHDDRVVLRHVLQHHNVLSVCYRPENQSNPVSQYTGWCSVMFSSITMSWVSVTVLKTNPIQSVSTQGSAPSCSPASQCPECLLPCWKPIHSIS